MSKVKFRCALYATNSTVSNAKFNWSVSGLQAALALILRYQKKGWYVKAAYLQKIYDGHVMQSKRIL